MHKRTCSKLGRPLAKYIAQLERSEGKLNIDSDAQQQGRTQGRTEATTGPYITSQRPDFEESPHGKMSGSWGEDTTMEQECGSIIRYLYRTEKNKSKLPPTGGRIWACCVSCPRAAVLAHLGWLATKHADTLRDQNGFVWTVCGYCERRDGRMFREGQVGGTRIRRDTTENSPAYRAIASHCTSSGWDRLSVKSERLLDRKALLQEHTSDITLKSVEVFCGEEGWAVRMLDYVEIAFL
jgi:hypothetical protein